MLDQIFIHQLTIPARIGVYPQEKLAPQPIELDITLYCDTRKAARTDQLADTVDYHQLSQRIAEHCLSQHLALVETLAQQLADLCLSIPMVSRVDIRLNKPQALSNTQHVGVFIQRKKQ